MAKVSVYSLLDRKLREFGNLVLERNDDGIRRSISAAVHGGGESMLVKYPEDFDLYVVGVFDTETGVFYAEAGPKLVENVRDIVASVREVSDHG